MEPLENPTTTSQIEYKPTSLRKVVSMDPAPQKTSEEVSPVQSKTKSNSNNTSSKSIQRMASSSQQNPISAFKPNVDVNQPQDESNLNVNPQQEFKGNPSNSNQSSNSTQNPPSINLEHDIQKNTEPTPIKAESTSMMLEPTSVKTSLKKKLVRVAAKQQEISGEEYMNLLLAERQEKFKDSKKHIDLEEVEDKPKQSLGNEPNESLEKHLEDEENLILRKKTSLTKGNKTENKEFTNSSTMRLEENPSNEKKDNLISSIRKIKDSEDKTKNDEIILDTSLFGSKKKESSSVIISDKKVQEYEEKALELQNVPKPSLMDFIEQADGNDLVESKGQPKSSHLLEFLKSPQKSLESESKNIKEVKQKSPEIKIPSKVDEPKHLTASNKSFRKKKDMEIKTIVTKHDEEEKHDVELEESTNNDPSKLKLEPKINIQDASKLQVNSPDHKRKSSLKPPSTQKDNIVPQSKKKSSVKKSVVKFAENLEISQNKNPEIIEIDDSEEKGKKSKLSKEIANLNKNVKNDSRKNSKSKEDKGSSPKSQKKNVDKKSPKKRTYATKSKVPNPEIAQIKEPNSPSGSKEKKAIVVEESDTKKRDANDEDIIKVKKQTETRRKSKEESHIEESVYVKKNMRSNKNRNVDEEKNEAPLKKRGRPKTSEKNDRKESEEKVLFEVENSESRKGKKKEEIIEKIGKANINREVVVEKSGKRNRGKTAVESYYNTRTRAKEEPAVSKKTKR